jgi:hypothetical protein
MIRRRMELALAKREVTTMKTLKKGGSPNTRNCTNPCTYYPRARHASIRYRTTNESINNSTNESTNSNSHPNANPCTHDPSTNSSTHPMPIPSPTPMQIPTPTPSPTLAPCQRLHQCHLPHPGPSTCSSTHARTHDPSTNLNT